jgi:FkbM family methyltransferase
MEQNLNMISAIISIIKNKWFASEQSKRVKPWFEANGDRTLRLDYNLNQESIVFDLGGYEGQWASDIFSRYVSIIYVFEPFLPYAQHIQDRFNRNHKIKVLAFGLGKKNEKLFLYENKDASSSFASKGKQHEIEIRNASDFIDKENIKFINLMKINIEGGEYALLEDLIDSGKVNTIENIQVQFHDFVPDARSRMKQIQEKLSLTHELTYHFEFVWENWKLKNK